MNPVYYLLTFSTASDAMAAEALLSEYGAAVVSTPSEIDAGCGFAVRLREPEPGLAQLKGRVNPEGLYRVTGRGRERCLQFICKC